MTIVKSMIRFYTQTNGGWGELISYEPFWCTLKRQNVSTYALINRYHISSATIDRMRKGLGISTMKIDDFCRILHCNVEDIIRYLPDEE